MVQNAQLKSDTYRVLNLDVVWTAEFAANRWIDEIPANPFPFDKMPESGQRHGQVPRQVYAVPDASDGGCCTTARTCWTRPA